VRLTHSKEKMAKKKKTRAEKIRANLRHRVPENSFYTLSPSIEKAQEIRPVIETPSALNMFFVKDLQKTFVLISGILITQLILFFILKNHILTIPFIGY